MKKKNFSMGRGRILDRLHLGEEGRRFREERMEDGVDSVETRRVPKSEMVVSPCGLKPRNKSNRITMI